MNLALCLRAGNPIFHFACDCVRKLDFTSGPRSASLARLQPPLVQLAACNGKDRPQLHHFIHVLSFEQDV